MFQTTSTTAPTITNYIGNSLHQPISLEIEVKTPIIRSPPKTRWNRAKAQWDKYAARLDEVVRCNPLRAATTTDLPKLLYPHQKSSYPVAIEKNTSQEEMMK